MSDLVERLRRRNDEHAGTAAPRLDAYATVRIMNEAAARIEALEAALNYVADMTYYGGGAEWHFKLGYDPQKFWPLPSALEQEK